MELSGYTYSFFRLLESRQMTTREVVEYYTSGGVTQVEISGPYVTDEDFIFLRKAVVERRLSIPCYDVVGRFDGRAWEPAVEDVRRDLERAKALDARCVLLIPAIVGNETSDESFARKVRRLYAEGLQRCVPEAKRLGLRVTVANLGYQALVCGTPDHIAEVGAVPGGDLGVTYDVGNYLMAREDPLAALNRVAPLVQHVHLKDWVVSDGAGGCLEAGGLPSYDGKCYRPVAVGQGIVDIQGVLRRLAEIGYAGVLSVEYEGLGDPRNPIEESAAYLRPLLDELEHSA